MTKERIVIIILGILLTGTVTMLIFSNSRYREAVKTGEEEKQTDNIMLENEEEEIESEKDGEEQVEEVIRHDGGYYSEGYKLFFGDWEITRVIANAPGYGNNVEMAEKNFSGKIITYTKDQFIYEGQYIDNPEYNISIIPIIDEHMSYYQRFPLKDLGITGEYFVYIYVRMDAFLPGKFFFIKDDNTLILVVDGAYMFELKRLSHIPNVENYYIMV